MNRAPSHFFFVGMMSFALVFVSATAAEAQCYIDISVYADGAVGGYYPNGNAELWAWGSATDNSSCQGAEHQYYGMLSVYRVSDGQVVAQVPEFSTSVEVTAETHYIDVIVGVWCSYFQNFVGGGQGGATINIPPPPPPSCGDDRDSIIEEYRAGQVAWTPGCNDFSTSGGTAHFSWSELNRSPGSGHPPYGIVKSVLWTGLEDTRSNYARGGIVIDSGYRCPHGNALVGGAYQSRHMWGDAADMHSQDNPWSQTEWNLLRNAAVAAGATYVEPYSQDPDHVHADWR
jgi:hypothetical protein